MYIGHKSVHIFKNGMIDPLQYIIGRIIFIGFHEKGIVDVPITCWLCFDNSTFDAKG